MMLIKKSSAAFSLLLVVAAMASAASSSDTSDGTALLRGVGGDDDDGRDLSASPTLSTVTYPPPIDVSTPLPNPERGLYWQNSYYASSPVRLDATDLSSRRESTGMTLILRLYYLDIFLESNISASVLDDIAADFDAMRSAGVKCVLRFAYIDDNSDPNAVTEPEKERLLGHIAQLGPVLADGEDVIAVVQAGLLGPWGEWHSSTHFDDDLIGKRQVLNALLDAVPVERMVQVRTPGHKQDIYTTYDFPDPVGGYLADGSFEGGNAGPWGPYMDGFELDASEFRTAGAAAKVTNGAAKQYVNFDAPVPSGHAVRISGYSKGVGTPPGGSENPADYAIYADVTLVDDADGTVSYMWGKTAEFKNDGTGSEWEYAQDFVIVPDGKSITGMTVYTMYRNQQSGEAYFDDVDVLVYGPPVQTEGHTVDAATAHAGTHISRTGHHNDCFLASSTDFGTYPDEEGSQYPYLSQETLYTAMGGETCNFNPPRSNCDKAIEEMKLFHYTYLNSGYHQAVLQSWKDDGCYDEVAAHLGYRLVLVDGTFPDTAAPGGVVPYTIGIRNDGYAAPVNRRRVQLVLRNVDTGSLCAATFDNASDDTSGVHDARNWHGGGEVHTLAGEVALPSDVPPGQYSLHLHIADMSPALRTKLEYKIKVANSGALNDPTTGLIDLGHTVSIAPGNPSALDGGGSGGGGGEGGEGATTPRFDLACDAGADIVPAGADAGDSTTTTTTTATTPPPGPANLVKNPSFESADVLAADWDRYSGGYDVVSAESHTGSRSVRVTDGGARQPVTLNAPSGSTVTVKGYSKAAGVVRTDLWNDYSVYTDVVYADSSKGYLWGQCARFSGAASTDVDDDGWQYSEHSFVLEHDASYLTLYTMYRNDVGGGAAYFDDVSVTVTPPPQQ